ncbi:hypothetical protein BSKO_01088 [Bryopsis sp. KO-2023]|nr:hypothetical protein BSKO_01088 [Bryopsis sp. KO-2023]
MLARTDPKLCSAAHVCGHRPHRAICDFGAAACNPSRRRQSTCVTAAQSTSSPNIASTRRGILSLLVVPVSLACEGNAEASILGPAVDNIWEGIGGGPPDLFYPDIFEGTWDVVSTLVNVETPLGPEYVPDIKVVNRAKSELNKPMQYSVRFFKGDTGKVITDRRFNTGSMLEMYNGWGMMDMIEWNPNDPNILKVNLPGETSALTRVTRRSETTVGLDRLETSEYSQQVFNSPNSTVPRLTASQCFTKYKWRSEEAAKGGPVIIATQVVSSYLTVSAGEQRMIEAMGKPVDVLTYRMAFMRPPVSRA